MVFLIQGALCQVLYPLERLQKLIGKLSNFYHIIVQMEGSEDLIKGTSILVISLINMHINFNLYCVDIIQKRGLQLLVMLVIIWGHSSCSTFLKKI